MASPPAASESVWPSAAGLGRGRAFGAAELPEIAAVERAFDVESQRHVAGVRRRVGQGHGEQPAALARDQHGRDGDLDSFDRAPAFDLERPPDVAFGRHFFAEHDGRKREVGTHEGRRPEAVDPRGLPVRGADGQFAVDDAEVARLGDAVSTVDRKTS